MSDADKASTPGLFSAVGISVAGLVLTIFAFYMGIRPLTFVAQGNFKAMGLPELIALLLLIPGVVFLIKGVLKLARVLKSSV